MQVKAFGAQQALVGGVVGIALHPDLAFGILLHHYAAAHPAVGTRGFKAFFLVFSHANFVLNRGLPRM
jgi:hypothetical protein